MSQSVEVGEINQIIVIGRNSFLSINSTTVTLWDSNNAQSLKTVMIPPGITITQAVAMSVENEFSLFVLTSCNTVIQFTKSTFDYSKAKVYQSELPIRYIAVVELNKCLIAKENMIGIINFTKESSEYKEVFKFNEPIETMIHYNNKILIGTKQFIHSYSLEGKELSKKCICNCEIKRLIVIKQLFVVCVNKIIILNNDLNISHEFIGNFNCINENDDFILLSGKESTQLISSQFNCPIKSLKLSLICGLNNKIILYYSNTLEFIDLPPKPTLSVCLKHMNSNINSKECDVNDYIGSVNGVFKNENLIGKEEEELPQFESTDISEFNQRIVSSINNNGNLRWNLWSAIKKRIEKEGSSTDIYWNLIIELINKDLIRDYTELLLLLIKENKLENIDFIIKKENITVNELPLLEIIRFAVKMQLGEIPFNETEQFIRHVFDREINAQTAPKMLSELNPNEVMVIIKYFIKQFDLIQPIGEQRILNWLMALFDAHITLLVTDHQFISPLKELFTIIQKEIQVSETCEALKPYIEQIKFNLPLPTVNTDEYVIVDLLFQ